MSNGAFGFINSESIIFSMEDLVGRTLKVTSITDSGITLIFAEDVDSGEFFLMDEKKEEKISKYKVMIVGDSMGAISLGKSLISSPNVELVNIHAEEPVLEGFYDTPSSQSALLVLVPFEKPDFIDIENNRCQCGKAIKGNKWNTCKRCRRKGFY